MTLDKCLCPSHRQQQTRSPPVMYDIIMMIVDDYNCKLLHGCQVIYDRSVFCIVVSWTCFSFTSHPRDFFTSTWRSCRLLNSVWECPYSMWECPYSTWECPYSMWECPYSTWECPYSMWECPYSMWECPYSMWECPYNMWECPYSMWECPYKILKDTCEFCVSESFMRGAKTA